MKYSILFFYIIGMFSLMVLVHEGIHLLYHKDIDDKRICLFSEGELAYVDFNEIVVYDKAGEGQLEEDIASLGGLITGLVGCVFLAKNKEVFN